jgi:hypothetical protein
LLSHVPVISLQSAYRSCGLLHSSSTGIVMSIFEGTRLLSRAAQRRDALLIVEPQAVLDSLLPAPAAARRTAMLFHVKHALL